MNAWKTVSLCAVCSIGAAALVAFAQPAGDKKAPAGPPDMQAMMEAYAKAAEPGKMHAHLAQSVGTWEGKVKMWMDPAAPPSESTCTTVISPMHGGRFTKCETKGKMQMGEKPTDFEGFGLYGYNNSTKKFESVWCDNMGTMMMNFTGELSADGKTLTWNTKFVDPMTGQESWMREVDRQTGPDTTVLEMYGPGMDGKEAKVMEIQYTRRKGGGTK